MSAHFRQSHQRVENGIRLRKTMTEEEVMLWSALRGYRKLGSAFRRQAPVGPYVADFPCRKAKVIIEVDGWHHDLPEQMAHDARRDAWLAERGYRILRLSACDVRKDIDNILRSIDALICRTS